MIETKSVQFPGPKGNFILGTAAEIMKTDITRFLLKYEQIYGPSFKYHIGKQRLLALGDHKYIREIYLEKNKQFPRGSAHDFVRLFLGNSILTNDGDSWKKSRLAFNASFSRNTMAKVYPLIISRIDNTIKHWSSTSGESRNLHHEMMLLTLNVLCDVIFGGALPEKIAKIIMHESTYLSDAVLNRFYNLFALPLVIPTPSNRRFNQSLKRFNDAIYEVLDERCYEGSPYLETSPFFKSLFQLMKDSPDPRKMARDEITGFLFAGHETSANALSWTIMLLLKHPDVLEKITLEVNSVLPNGKIPEIQDLDNLVFTNAVLKESMRLYPPAWGLGRVCVEDCVIGEFKVKAGTVVQILPLLSHRSSKYWKDPLSFKPERFLGEDANNPAFIPFLMGSHFCIGQTMANIEMLATLSGIISKLNFTADSEFDFEAIPMLTYLPKNPPMIQFSRK